MAPWLVPDDSKKEKGETPGLGCFPVSTTEVRQRNVGKSIPSKTSITSGVVERKREPQQMVRNEDSAAESKLDPPVPVRLYPFQAHKPRAVVRTLPSLTAQASQV